MKIENVDEDTLLDEAVGGASHDGDSSMEHVSWNAQFHLWLSSACCLPFSILNFLL